MPRVDDEQRHRRDVLDEVLPLAGELGVGELPEQDVRFTVEDRWEIELGFGEMKTDMLERPETIRSKSQAAVAQEMWGLLIAYNLIRLEMERIAAELGVHPTRISFVAALREFVNEWHLVTIVSQLRAQGPG